MTQAAAAATPHHLNITMSAAFLPTGPGNLHTAQAKPQQTAPAGGPGSDATPQWHQSPPASARTAVACKIQGATLPSPCRDKGRRPTCQAAPAKHDQLRKASRRLPGTLRSPELGTQPQAQPQEGPPKPRQPPPSDFRTHNRQLSTDKCLAIAGPTRAARGKRSHGGGPRPRGKHGAC